MKIYTKTGDKGETSLHGGRRVPKDDARVDAYGTVDELNAVVGMALAEDPGEEIRAALLAIQRQLFAVGADLATPSAEGGDKVKRVGQEEVQGLERLIDALNARLPALTAFVHPGGSSLGARLHFARTVCRRAERCVVRLSHTEAVGEGIVPYLNRLSDLLFVLARYANSLGHSPEIPWKP